MKHRPYVVYGGYGGVNIGDEAILTSLVHVLSSFEVEVDYVICRHSPDAITLKRYNAMGVDLLLKSNIAKIIRLSSSRNLLIGGGQLLNSGSRGRGLIYILLLCFIFRLRGSKVHLIAVSGNMVYRAHDRIILGLIGALSHTLSIREKSSIPFFRKKLFGWRKVQYCPDLVFSIPEGNELEGVNSYGSDKDSLPDIHGGYANKSVIVPRYEPGGDLEGSVLIVMRAVSIIDPHKHEEWLIVPHDVRDGFDPAVCSVLLHRMKVEGYHVKTYHVSGFHEALRLYRSAVRVLSVRMHPLILGFVAGGNPVAIMDSGKVKDFVLQIKGDGSTLDDFVVPLKGEGGVNQSHLVKTMSQDVYKYIGNVIDE